MISSDVRKILKRPQDPLRTGMENNSAREVSFSNELVVDEIVKKVIDNWLIFNAGWSYEADNEWI